MPTQTRSRVFKLQAGEIEDWAVGFGLRLAASETLVGTPKVTVHDRVSPEAQYAGVVVSQIARNVAPVVDADGVTHGINKAVECRVTAANDAVAGQYTLRTECGTSTGRSIVEPITINLAGPPET